MFDEKKILTLLEVTVPPDTPLTVASEIKMLEILGIIDNPELTKAMNIATVMVPANTPATLHALIILLGNVIKYHPKATKEHHNEAEKVLKKFTGVPDGALTYGTFLSICEALMKAIRHKRENREEKK
jgi:hypothetical protein